jgi:colanic acid biosynthesis glycosyl transferase WcaI
VKILIYCINFAPEQIGIGKYTGEMAAWLARRGHEIHVVTAHPYYPAWHTDDGYASWRFFREEWNGCSVWRCPLWVPARPTALTRIFHLLSFSLSSLPAMIQQVRWRPEIVFAVEPPLLCAPTALLISHLTGGIGWLHVQDFEIEAFFGLGFARSGLLKRILVSLEGWLMRRFDRVSTISHRMLDRIHHLKVPPERTALFPNWVDTRQIHPETKAGLLRKTWGVGDDQKVVLYAGNMGKKQGIDIVLRVAHMIQTARPDILFFLVGDGTDKENLIAQARQLCLRNVFFKPVQPMQTLLTLLNLAEVHLVIQRRGAADAVMPSKLSGILAAGGAALITADAETELGRFVDDHPGIAVLVEPENPASLLSALISLVDDRDRQRRCKSAARAYAECHLSTNTILSQFEASIKSACKPSSPN